MRGGTNGIDLGDIPRATRASTSFIGVDDDVEDEEMMREKFQEYLWRWHQAESGDLSDTAKPGKNGMMKRKRSIMGKMFKKPAIGQVLNVEFDENTQESRNRKRRWSRGEHREHAQLLLSPETEGGCACVINPDNLMRQLWDIVAVTICLIYSAIRVPYVIAFDIGLYSLSLSHADNDV